MIGISADVLQAIDRRSALKTTGTLQSLLKNCVRMWVYNTEIHVLLSFFTYWSSNIPVQQKVCLK